MTPKELRVKSPVELGKLLSDNVSEYVALKMKHATNQLEKNHRIGEVRRQIARLKTIIHEKRSGLGKP